MEESEVAAALSADDQGDGADVPRHCGLEQGQSGAINGGAVGSDQPDRAHGAVVGDAVHQNEGATTAAVPEGKPQDGAAHGSAGYLRQGPSHR